MTLDLPVIDEAWVRDRYWAPLPGETVLDIGSCDGDYTLPALAARATVYAVDARAETLRTLQDLASDSKLDARLTTMHVAVHDRKRYPKGLLDAIVNSRYESSRDMTPDRDVTWMTLDDLVDLLGLHRLDWVKIDVEGGELGVLRGAQRTLRELRPILLIEDHSRVYPWVEKHWPIGLILAELVADHYSYERIAGNVCDYVIATPR